MNLSKNEISDFLCQNIMNTANTFFAIFDINGKIINMNLGFAELLKRFNLENEPSKIFQAPTFDFFLSGIQNKENNIKINVTIGNEKDTYLSLISNVMYFPDSFYFYGEYNAFEAYELNKEFILLNNEIHDLNRLIHKKESILQKTLKDLSKSNAELERIDKEKNKYISVILHDLRSPISGVLCVLELLKKSVYNSMSQEEKELFDLTITTCHDIIKMTGKLFDINTIRNGIVKLNKEPADYNILISDIVKFNQIITNQNEISLKYEIEQSLPKLNIDKDKIKEVLNNLISNAIKYSNKGSEIKVKVTLINDGVLTSVYDNGPGIQKNEIEQLFKEFSTTSNKAVTQEKSTGLGLAICKRIIESHNGSINVESEFGKGSNFYFILPIQ